MPSPSSPVFVEVVGARVEQVVFHRTGPTEKADVSTSRSTFSMNETPKVSRSDPALILVGVGVSSVRGIVLLRGTASTRSNLTGL